jgi:hypothetical chaperone protein
MIDLNDVEEDLQIAFDASRLIDASRDDTARIVAAARETVRLAGIAPREVGALYFTGGSTGLAFLSGALAQAFPDAQPVYGDRLASVATGLGIYARRLFAGA